MSEYIEISKETIDGVTWEITRNVRDLGDGMIEFLSEISREVKKSDKELKIEELEARILALENK